MNERNRDYEISYGIDNLEGFFIKVFDKIKAVGEDGEVLVSLSQYKDGLTVERLIRVAEDYGFIIEPPEQEVIYD